MSRWRAGARLWRIKLFRNDHRRQFEAGLLCCAMGNGVLALSAPPWLSQLNTWMLIAELIVGACYWRKPQWLLPLAWVVWLDVTIGAVLNTYWIGGVWSANIGYFLPSSVGLLMVINLRAVQASILAVSVCIAALIVLEFLGYMTPSPIPAHDLRWPLASFFVLFFAFVMLTLILHGTQKTVTKRLQRDHQHLAETEASLRNQYRVQEQFVAAVSHELRAPIHAILGLMQTIQHRDALDPSEQHLLHHVEQSSRQLLLRVNELLDFSQLRAGKLRVRAQAFHLPHELAQRVREHEAGAQAKGLQLRLDVDPGVPVWVSGDRERIAQVLRNLLTNAIKFTTHGRIHLSVSAQGRNIEFSVRDTGSGIAEDELGRVFSRLSTLTSRTRREMGGTGLGLSITKALVELMEGDISVHSTVGMGTIFTVSLPLPMVGREASTAHPPNRVDGRASTIDDATLLIVDDSAINRLVAKNMLLAEFPHMTLIEADGGETAIEKLRTHTVDLVLMDLIMPGLNGIETTKRLHQEFGDTMPWVVGVTADTSDEARDGCHEVGMRALLHKPFDRQSLCHMVTRMLQISNVQLSEIAHTNVARFPSSTR